MTQLKLTPAQQRFIEEFDIYTRRGTDPKEFRPLHQLWRMQHRTMNWCHRNGLLAKKGISSKTGNPVYVINPEMRMQLGLRTPVFKARFLRPRKRLTAAQ